MTSAFEIKQSRYQGFTVSLKGFTFTMSIGHYRRAMQINWNVR